MKRAWMSFKGVALCGAWALAAGHAQAFQSELINLAEARVGVSITSTTSSPQAQLLPDELFGAWRYTDVGIASATNELGRTVVDLGLDMSSQFVDAATGELYAYRVSRIDVQQTTETQYGSYDMLDWRGSFTAPDEGTAHWFDVRFNFTGDVRDAAVRVEGRNGSFTHPRTGATVAVPPAVTFDGVRAGTAGTDTFLSVRSETWDAGRYGISAPGVLTLGLENARGGSASRFGIELVSQYFNVRSVTQDTSYSFTTTTLERVSAVPEAGATWLALAGAGLAVAAARRRRQAGA
ncbi:hypothetical protein EYS42_14935 [Aquabacterium lacunae]|uniref:Ice-binding protein C-terminal domain-containing protein n=1 Tax=Aquabacterium lacunae TaxID=2528630 RepID=A0A4Q9GVZ1_9BURK|nr:hypothetical protein [Aquabacterium lacunae]TBO28299.1 hypothetical protein EYS42_14935 [Aquabacterium lacunae]